MLQLKVYDKKVSDIKENVQSVSEIASQWFSFMAAVHGFTGDLCLFKLIDPGITSALRKTEAKCGIEKQRF